VGASGSPGGLKTDLLGFIYPPNRQSQYRLALLSL